MSVELLRFGPFELDPVRRVLRRAGEIVPVRPKALSLLQYLLENNDRIISKDELLGALWPEGFGTDANLTVNIAAVRRALGEHPQEHRYVVTVPTIGYRFVAEVDRVGSDANPTHIRFESLAVLPLRVLGGGPDIDSESLSLGLADTMVESLSNLARLSVRSAGDAHALVAEAGRAPLAEVGEKLQVDAVLSGTLRIDAEMIQVDLELRRCRDGEEIWSHQFQQECCELNALPVHLTRTVVSALRNGDRTRATQVFHRRYTDRDDAFQLYLQGRYHFWNGSTPVALRRAIECFDRAIALDPEYALAYSGAADTHLQIWTYGLSGSPDLMTKAREMASRAIELDPLLSDAHCTMGRISMLLDWDWASAREHFLAAIEYQPQNAFAHDGYALFLAARGRLDEAQETIRRAQRLDPLSLKIHTDLAMVLNFAGRTDEAIQLLENAMERDAGFFIGRLLQAWMCIGAGRTRDALGHARQLPELIGENALTDAVLGAAYAISENEEKAREHLANLERRERTGAVNPSDFAIIHMCLGENELALDRLEEAYRQRYAYLVYIDADALWNPLREEPRFLALRDRVLGHRD